MLRSFLLCHPRPFGLGNVSRPVCGANVGTLRYVMQDDDDVDEDDDDDDDIDEDGDDDDDETDGDEDEEEEETWQVFAIRPFR